MSHNYSSTHFPKGVMGRWEAFSIHPVFAGGWGTFKVTSSPNKPNMTKRLASGARFPIGFFFDLQHVAARCHPATLPGVPRFADSQELLPESIAQILLVRSRASGAELAQSNSNRATCTEQLAKNTSTEQLVQSTCIEHLRGALAQSCLRRAACAETVLVSPCGTALPSAVRSLEASQTQEVTSESARWSPECLPWRLKTVGMRCALQAS